jgi:hypothetical protein
VWCSYSGYVLQPKNKIPPRKFSLLCAEFVRNIFQLYPSATHYIVRIKQFYCVIFLSWNVGKFDYFYLDIFFIGYRTLIFCWSLNIGLYYALYFKGEGQIGLGQRTTIIIQILPVVYTDHKGCIFFLLWMKEETIIFECFDLIWPAKIGEIIKHKTSHRQNYLSSFSIFLLFYGIICCISNEILWGSVGHVTNSVRFCWSYYQLCEVLLVMLPVMWSSVGHVTNSARFCWSCY